MGALLAYSMTAVYSIMFQMLCIQGSLLQSGRELYFDTLSDVNIVENDNSSVMITVWQANGEDTPECVSQNEDLSCKSLHYAYETAMNNLSSSTTHLILKIRDSIYKISSPLEINMASNSLQYLEISSYTNQATIEANSSEAVLKIGCNSTRGKSCISYAVYFKHLILESFTSFFPSVIMIFTSPYVEIMNCTFRNNNCSAINSLDTPIVITETTFFENHGNNDFRHGKYNSSGAFPNSNTSNGGATAFIFQYAANVTIKIQHCHFKRNTASMKYQSPYINHSINDTAFPRVGGGIVAAFMGHTNNNKFFVTNTIFEENRAYSAGGIAVLMQSDANMNNIYIKHCKFENNFVQSTSGAILFAIWDYSFGNGMFITNSQFVNNTANFAGGLKLIINNFEIPTTNAQNHRLEIINSKFCKNKAESGSAMHLVHASLSQHLMLQHALIKNCTFCEHKSFTPFSKPSPNLTSSFGGTILTHKINLKFAGECYIVDNNAGCGIFASNANIHVLGLLVVKGNIADIAGAGMNLNDMSKIVLHPGSHLKFLENFSRDKGGAISVTTVGMPGLVYIRNPFCFLQYIDSSLPPSKWDIKLEFIKNGAEFKAGAIFINTLTACLWCEEPPHHSFERALKWNKNFIYEDNYVSEMFTNILGVSNDNYSNSVDIATDTSKLVFNQHKEIEASPGESFQVHLAGEDELGNQIHSVTSATSICRDRNGSIASSHMLISNRYYVLAPFNWNRNISLSYLIDDQHYKSITENRNVSHEIKFTDSYSSFDTRATLNVRPVACRPGFGYSRHQKTCVCNTSISLVIRCVKSTVILQHGYWATNDSNGNLYIRFCPVGYCNCSSPADNLSGCAYDYKHPDKQCVHGRHGTLCGACITGRGLAMHSGKCVPCDETTAAIIQLIFIVIVVLIVACLVIYLNPNFSTKMRGPLFYTQILPYVFNARDLFGGIVQGITSVTALGGPAGLPLEACINEQFDKLDVNALTYIFAVVILLVLAVVYLLDHFYVLNFKRDSPFEAFWILLVGIYIFFSETSLMFYYCVPIIPGGKLVFFYDGSLTCYKGRHLIMVIVSSIVLFLFVLLPPIMVILICNGCFNVPLQVIDALTKGLRDPFRWWWAVALIRRLAFVAIYVLVPYENVTRVLLVILSIMTLALHAQCQPYRSEFANFSETMILVSISILATFQASEVNYPEIVNYSKIVVGVTIVYIFGLFLYLFVNFIRRRCKGRNKTDQPFQNLENEQVNGHRRNPPTPSRAFTNNPL